jgi:thioredoxin 1
MSETIETFDDQSFEREISDSTLPVLVDFWAEWCRPCIAMVPDLEAVAKMYTGKLRVAKLNVEENSSTPIKYAITSLPTLLMFKGGRVAEQRVGKLSKSALVKLIDQNS